MFTPVSNIKYKENLHANIKIYIILMFDQILTLNWFKPNPPQTSKIHNNYISGRTSSRSFQEQIPGLSGFLFP